MSEWENVRMGKCQKGKISEWENFRIFGENFRIHRIQYIWGKFPNFVKYENFQKLGKIHLKNHQKCLINQK